MATHSSTLAWKIPGTEEPCRLQSTGSQRVGHDWATSLDFLTLIKLCCTKALEWSSLVSGPKAKSSSSEITYPTPFTVSYHHPWEQYIYSFIRVCSYFVTVSKWLFTHRNIFSLWFYTSSPIFKKLFRKFCSLLLFSFLYSIEVPHLFLKLSN